MPDSRTGISLAQKIKEPINFGVHPEDHICCLIGPPECHPRSFGRIRTGSVERESAIASTGSARQIERLVLGFLDGDDLKIYILS